MSLLGVVGAGGIAGAGRMPRYFSWMSCSRREVFGPAVAPVVAGLLVQVLGEGFGEAVGERLGHDRVVVVVVCLEARGQVEPMPVVTAKAPR